MAYRDLREWLDQVNRLGELKTVEGADWDLELGAITEVVARATKPKVLLFDNIKGYPNGFRVVTNPVCSAATTASPRAVQASTCSITSFTPGLLP